MGVRSPQKRAILGKGSPIGSAVYAQVTLYFTILYNGTPLSPSKLILPIGSYKPPSNAWFPGPNRILNPNGISIGSAIFAGLTSGTERLTHHTTRSVTIDRMYIRSTSRPLLNAESTPLTCICSYAHDEVIGSHVQFKRDNLLKWHKIEMFCYKLQIETDIWPVKQWQFQRP